MDEERIKLQSKIWEQKKVAATKTDERKTRLAKLNVGRERWSKRELNRNRKSGTKKGSSKVDRRDKDSFGKGKVVDGHRYQ